MDSPSSPVNGHTNRPTSQRRRLPCQARRRHPGRQGGTIAIMSVASLLLILCVCGMAIDLSRIYNRKAELNAVTRAAALAAANELNGTAGGIAEALRQASAVAATLRYEYGSATFAWSDTALTFSTLPARDGNWRDATSASATPAGVYYARVDSGEFEDAGLVDSFLMSMFSDTNASSHITDVAIAGRTTVRAIPMAVCAMDEPAIERENIGSSGNARELVEYGFRRGITYDLMRLNPNGTTPAHFVLDPFRSPGASSAVNRTSAQDIRPFICAGVMWLPHVKGGPVGIAPDFPLQQVFQQLNSRFDLYEGAVGERCEPGGAPPDLNVMQYTFDLPLPWMSASPAAQGAHESTDNARLATVADLASMPAAATPPMYGPLWNFAKAVPYSAYLARPVEPAAGYSSFTPGQWGNLYKPAPTARNYPATNPYMSGLPAHTLQPSLANRGKAERYRRVLNVPLLSCPVATGSTSADVLAVGRFFMTVQASDTNLYAEFAGIASEAALRGKVELFP